MDGLMIGLGITILALAIPAIIRPESLHKESLRNRNRRLEELRNGAPERYFEEQRELEAYRPRFDPSSRTIRALGFVGVTLGVLSLFQGISQ
ncbi:hypothetical protein [Erythrobacter sp. JK5]|uniref:hypothetical protein n=1 Tax=Erythrobacter sp. JK5 TaxID=2829500 RepID=UPI001BA6EEA6|nr:hypothetical protein [Erythrobacter sp. JK5]QUL38278.1 hypothetical protein KDC96_02345 [Erythrobacter sp. JK5]